MFYIKVQDLLDYTYNNFDILDNCNQETLDDFESLCDVYNEDDAYIVANFFMGNSLSNWSIVYMDCDYYIEFESLEQLIYNVENLIKE